MTVRVEREMEVPGGIEEVWSFLSAPDERARAISVVEEWDENADGTVTWHVSLPIPVVRRTVAVETEDRERRPPEFVRFVGRSRVFRVQGEHELSESDGATRVVSRFVVDGRLPGVERFFKRQLDAELDNLEAALRDSLEVTA